jgi:hypothetical protein
MTNNPWNLKMDGFFDNANQEGEAVPQQQEENAVRTIFFAFFFHFLGGPSLHKPR